MKITNMRARSKAITANALLRHSGGCSWACGLLLAAALAASPVIAAVAAERQGFEHFITRRGNRLYDGPRPFRFIGANMPGLVLPYDFTLARPERMRLPTPWEQEDGLKSLDQMNLRVVRTWNLPIRAPDQTSPGGGMTWHYVQAPGQFNEESFQVIDHMLALANRYRVRVIFDLTAESGDFLGGIGTYAAHRGKKRQEFYTDPQLKADFQATIRYVLHRVNTLTGTRYKDDKAILAWQFGNEMYSAPREWLSEMAAYIKQLDPNHLVAETRHRPGQPMDIDPNIDLHTRHYYGNYAQAYGKFADIASDWTAALRAEVARLQGQRPLFIGEFGPYVGSGFFTHENVVDKLREFLEYVRQDEAIAGAMIWSMYFHHRDGGFYWHQIFTYPAVWSYHWPGFPSAEAQREIGIMRAMREAAFKIEGRPVPPVPAPDPPEMLPVSGVPLLSWRGSAGASGYDIQRATASRGPWTTIAENVSDADVAYRPLWSDTTAEPGRRYFYRAVARNTSGRSEPSRPVGPLRVERVCLADELQDLSRAKSHSGGLQLDNAYNGLYAEYLFRARGDTGDWLLYEVPRPIQSVRVVAFYAKTGSPLKLQGSADGQRFLDLQAEQAETALPRPPTGPARGQQRTIIVQESSPPGGPRWLKILWSGPAELDRVEVFY